MAKTGYRMLPNDERTKKQFENMCAIQCTKEEIAGVFEVSGDTLLRWVKENYNGETFATIFKRYSASGRMSLRRYQFNQSKKSSTMAIWLGKQYLGQRDQQNVSISGDEEADPLTIAIKRTLGKIEDDDFDVDDDDEE